MKREGFVQCVCFHFYQISLPSPPLPSPSLPLVTERIHSPFQPKQSPSCNLLRGPLDGRPARWTELLHCVGFVRYTETTSGCVRSGRERFASVWLCRVNALVDASDASGRERRTVCACLLTDVFISTDTIHMTRKGNISHELSTCNWVTTGRKADAVCTRRSGHVSFASGQSFVVWMQTRR